MVFKMHNILFEGKRHEKTEIRIEYNKIKDDLDERLSDYLSNWSGFCHKGFDIEFKDNKIFAKNIDWDYDEDDEQNLSTELEITNEILKETLKSYFNHRFKDFDITFED